MDGLETHVMYYFAVATFLLLLFCNHICVLLLIDDPVRMWTILFYFKFSVYMGGAFPFVYTSSKSCRVLVSPPFGIQVVTEQPRLNL